MTAFSTTYFSWFVRFALGLVVCLWAAAQLTTAEDTSIGANFDAFSFLFSLYNSTNGPFWSDACSAGWRNHNSNPDPCDPLWFGITCTNPTTNASSSSNVAVVTGISLTGCGLSGTLPPWVGATLNYTNAPSTRTRILLRTFDISNNSVRGSLPMSYGLAASPFSSSVRVFVVNSNQLSGTLPSQYSSWGSTFASFQANDNDFTGTLPEDYKNWTSLNRFDVSFNRLTGTLPSTWSNWTSLEVLDLSNNRLSGTFPAMIFSERLPQLRVLDIHNNVFIGSIPVALIAWWPKLTDFRAESNLFSGNISTIDNEIVKLSNTVWNWTCSLQVFIITFNKGVFGTLPASFSSCRNMTTFQALNLSLTGTLPADYGEAWANTITSFNVRLSNLVGTIPDSFAKWTKLILFDVGANNLTGNVSAVMQNWRLLETLRLANNQFFGTIPQTLINNSNLIQLYLHYNRFVGTVDSQLGPGCPSMFHFYVQGNLLTGTLPNSFSVWRNIQRFFVHNNSFQGTLPSSWADWGPSIQQVNLGNNQFNGSLPPQWSSWSNVSAVSAVVNQLTGELPTSWGNWKTAGTLTLDRNSLSGMLPNSWGSLPAMSALGISDNQLSGPLPSWSLMKKIFFLGLQGNQNLSGSIILPPIFPLFVTICQTGLNLALSPTSISCCLPQDADLTYLYENPSDVYSYCGNLVTSPSPDQPVPTAAPSSLSPTSVPSSILPSPLPVLLAASRNAAGLSIVGSAAAAAAIGGDPGSAQMLASLLLSKCMCTSSGGALSASDDDDVFFVVVSSLTLSPFTALGPAAMAFGNSVIILLIFACPMLLVLLIQRRTPKSSSQTSRVHSRCRNHDVSLDQQASLPQQTTQRWAALCRSPQAIALRFPNLSVAGALFLFPGLVRGFVVVFGDMNSIHLDFAAAIFALVILIVYSIFVLEWIVYRALILQNFQEHNTSEGRARHLRSPLHPAASTPLHFEPYDTPHPFTPPLPKWIAAIAFPRGGRWMPADKRNSFGVLVSPLKPSHTHWWLAMPLLTIVTTLLSSLPTNSTVGCDALQGIITTASAAMSVALVAVRPHRALIVSIVAAASLIVVAVTSALGLACRHGLVSLDELLSVCSVLSYVTLVGKVYVALLPSFENKILERRLPRLSLQNNTFATLSSFQSIANEQHRKRDWSIHRERQHVGLTRLVKNICWHVKNNQVPSLAKQELTGQRLENCFEFGRLT